MHMQVTASCNVTTSMRDSHQVCDTQEYNADTTAAPSACTYRHKFTEVLQPLLTLQLIDGGGAIFTEIHTLKTHSVGGGHGWGVAAVAGDSGTAV